jgi:hypothetical protein
METQGIEVVYGEGKKKSLVPERTNQGGPLSFELYEFPFTSVSAVSRGHPSMIFLQVTINVNIQIYTV